MYRSLDYPHIFDTVVDCYLFSQVTRRSPSGPFPLVDSPFNLDGEGVRAWEFGEFPIHDFHYPLLDGTLYFCWGSSGDGHTTGAFLALRSSSYSHS